MVTLSQFLSKKIKQSLLFLLLLPGVLLGQENNSSIITYESLYGQKTNNRKLNFDVLVTPGTSNVFRQVEKPINVQISEDVKKISEELGLSGADKEQVEPALQKAKGMQMEIYLLLKGLFEGEDRKKLENLRDAVKILIDIYWGEANTIKDDVLNFSLHKKHVQDAFVQMKTANVLLRDIEGVKELLDATDWVIAKYSKPAAPPIQKQNSEQLLMLNENNNSSVNLSNISVNPLDVIYTTPAVNNVLNDEQQKNLKKQQEYVQKLQEDGLVLNDQKFISQKVIDKVVLDSKNNEFAEKFTPQDFNEVLSPLNKDEKVFVAIKNQKDKNNSFDGITLIFKKGEFGYEYFGYRTASGSDSYVNKRLGPLSSQLMVEYIPKSVVNKKNDAGVAKLFLSDEYKNLSQEKKSLIWSLAKGICSATEDVAKSKLEFLGKLMTQPVEALKEEYIDPCKEIGKEIGEIVLLGSQVSDGVPGEESFVPSLNLNIKPEVQEKVNSLVSKYADSVKMFATMYESMNEFQRIELLARLAGGFFIDQKIVPLINQKLIHCLSEGGKVVKTGTVWDYITKAAEPYFSTKIPKYFELSVGGKKFWVSQSATKHMEEYLLKGRDITHGMPMASQNLLASLKAAVEKAIKNNLIVFDEDKKVLIDCWELAFRPSKKNGLFPSIMHAVYLPEAGERALIIPTKMAENELKKISSIVKETTKGGMINSVKKEMNLPQNTNPVKTGLKKLAQTKLIIQSIQPKIKKKLTTRASNLKQSPSVKDKQQEDKKKDKEKVIVKPNKGIKKPSKVRDARNAEQKKNPVQKTTLLNLIPLSKLQENDALIEMKDLDNLNFQKNPPKSFIPVFSASNFDIMQIIPKEEKISPPGNKPTNGTIYNYMKPPQEIQKIVSNNNVQPKEILPQNQFSPVINQSINNVQQQINKPMKANFNFQKPQETNPVNQNIDPQRRMRLINQRFKPEPSKQWENFPGFCKK